MGSSGSRVDSWVRASQSWPPYGIRTPPWQDVAAHAAPTVSDHSWPYTTRVVQSSSAVPDNTWTMASHLLRPWRTCLAGLPDQAHDVDRLHTARTILVTR